jgi:small GTP-binding protein
VIQKKVALLGASGVGKTSLVRRFVESLFDDHYLTTIGVKVDKKAVRVGGQEVTLMLWDVAGAEERFTVPTSYVRGAAGFLLVVDGTRPETLAVAAEIAGQVEHDLGPLPFVLVFNKADLEAEWQLTNASLGADAMPVHVVHTSAKTGHGVEEAFNRLAEALV